MNRSNSLNRREFMRNSALSAAAIGLSASALPAFASELKKDAAMKVGLYSITYLGVWYKGEAMKLDDMIVKAKKFGFDGIEIDGKRPHGNPLDMPTKRCKEIKQKANDLGLEVYAVSGNNDFSSPVPEHRECQVVYMRELIRMTSDLEVKPLRVFLGWPGVTLHPEGGRYDIAKDIWQYAHYQYSPQQTWDWCREGLIECAKYAEDFGVTLALQNHKPVINDWRDVMRMVKEVDSPALKVCLDAPIMDDKSPENINAASKAVGDLQVLSHFGGEFGVDDKGILRDLQKDHNQVDAQGNVITENPYPDFLKAMKGIGYSGYMSYELCHPLPLENGEKVGIEFVDRCAENACKFMKGLIKEV